ncbi:glycosyltransferase [Clostridium estertheticum]|uniref:Glycosyltransferase n=1 Tax=Clostridium estertheticum TaxID=238834 RepID=A0A5N7J5I1_9CLOT|nr:glycosyltransferase [Clostridium estertheticum]MPQ33284.1 glycosyltransferase [Clostridium estertheticum]MPQ63942.1 glycosyltransferase [Clostridium estertheticum]
MCKFSIIVPTYNSQLSKVFLTIESILRQTFTDYEIIITDDGSFDNNFDKIKGYLINRNFKNYTFIEHEKNQGTVKNMQNAYINCNGEYIKGLGPGDLLYSESILAKLSIFLDSRNSNFAFGRLKSYYLENNVVNYHQFVAPPNNLIYSYENKYKAIENTLERKLYISGSTMVFRKDYILQSKFNLMNVKYCEDLVQVLVAINEDKIDFYDSNFIWYEYGSGISTNKKQPLKLEQDDINFYKDLFKQFPQNKMVKKSFNNIRLNSINNPIKKNFLKLINNPKKCLYRMDNILRKTNVYENSDETGFLVEGLSPSLVYIFEDIINHKNYNE